MTTMNAISFTTAKGAAVTVSIKRSETLPSDHNMAREICELSATVNGRTIFGGVWAFVPAGLNNDLARITIPMSAEHTVIVEGWMAEVRAFNAAITARNSTPARNAAWQHDPRFGFAEVQS